MLCYYQPLICFHVRIFSWLNLNYTLNTNRIVTFSLCVEDHFYFKIENNEHDISLLIGQAVNLKSCLTTFNFLFFIFINPMLVTL